MAKLDLQKATNNLQNKGLKVIGWLCWYSLESQVLHKMFLKAFKYSGLPKSYKIKPVRTWQAFRRAVKFLEKESEGRAFAKMHHNDIDKAAATVFMKDEEDGVDYKKSGTVTLDKESGKLKIKGKILAKIFKKLYSAFSEYHNHDDIRRMLVDYLMEEAEAHAVRDNGGVYFIPKTNIEELAKLRAFMKKLGCRLSVIPVPNTKSGKTEIGHSFLESVKSALIKTHQQLEKISGTRYRTKEMSNRLQSIKTLRDSISKHKKLLGFESSEEEKTITTLVKRVKNLIDTAKVR